MRAAVYFKAFLGALLVAVSTGFLEPFAADFLLRREVHYGWNQGLAIIGAVVVFYAGALLAAPNIRTIVKRGPKSMV
jgi:hypothetical protein